MFIISKQKTKKLTKEELNKIVDFQDTEIRKYTRTQLAEIFKNIKVPYATSYKNAYVVMRLVDMDWLYFVLGYTNSSGIMTCFVKGLHNEAGTQYLDELTQYNLQVKVLEKPIPMNELSALYR